ncbi:MAG TPA: EcsC family protein [Candidatus Binatia bacterium]|nr:EcsC family protein [Candidatus Binatia bacterium]
MATPLSYEQKALRDTRRWLARDPGWGARLLAAPGTRLARLMEALLPTSALRRVLEGADRLGRNLADRRSILKAARAESLEALRDRSLAEQDALALRMARRASLLAGAGGALFGIAGAAGLAADVPTLLTLALRTIHRTGLCYGDAPAADEERSLALGIFALASANTVAERQAAWAALLGDDDPVAAAWREGVERVAERALAKEAATLSLQVLAQRIGVNLGKRKAAGSLPVLGAAVGAAVNASYLADVAEAARHVFRMRRLGTSGKR